MFDDADRSVQLALQMLGIVDRSKRTVQDVMAAIGDERLSLTCRSSHQTRAETCSLLAVACHANGTTSTATEPWTPRRSTSLVSSTTMISCSLALAMIFSRSSAPPRPFRRLSLPTIDLVCPVDRDVNVIVLRQRGERDTQATSLSLRLL